MPPSESLLDPQAKHYLEIIDDLQLEQLNTRYQFMDGNQFKDLAIYDVGASSRIYWHEMLQRAHLASVTAILRSRYWLSAVMSAADDGNFLAFAASYRGLMESAADTSTSLRMAPLTMASSHRAITEALSGRAQIVFTSKKLEDELIHYSHARFLRRSEREGLPESHTARTSQEYLQFMAATESVDDDVRRCYRFLCDVTHPAATTVWMWLAQVDVRGLQYELAANQSPVWIEAFLETYPSMTLDLFMFGFNVPVMTLNMLNYFPIESLHTPQLLTWNLDSIPGWIKCRDELQRLRISPYASPRQP